LLLLIFGKPKFIPGEVPYTVFTLDKLDISLKICYFYVASIGNQTIKPLTEYKKGDLP
jgi:hypothetical protein